ncbi:histone-lysine N-methyltransferase PRDM16-like [Lytechinus pictus]|uniref:histone-lysine N-methyltransferase PRDM16-like n=1 Tax=Lytechinus pictus TaxID=7653 RepID=UPI0030B9B9EE
MRHRVASDFECFDCGARFSHKRSLHRHIDERHRRQRLYTCDICEKGYSRRDNLRAHMVSHERRSKVRSEVHLSDKGGKEREREKGRETREHEEKTTTRICSEVQEPTIAEAEIQVDVSPGTMEAVNSWKMGPGLSGKPLSLLRQQVQDEQSEESESDLEDEQEGGMDLPEKVKLGKPIGDLKPTRILAGNLVRVAEHSSAYVFSGGSKSIYEEKARTYHMVVVKAVGSVPEASYTKINHVREGHVGPAMSVEDLERGLIGNLKTLTEKTTRRVFRNGEIVSEDEVIKEFTVDMMVGTTKAETD